MHALTLGRGSVAITPTPPSCTCTSSFHSVLYLHSTHYQLLFIRDRSFISAGGTIPASIGNLTQMEMLYALYSHVATSKNSLELLDIFALLKNRCASSFIPCFSLRTLVSMQLSGSIPVELCNLRKLYYMYLTFAMCSLCVVIRSLSLSQKLRR